MPTISSSGHQFDARPDRIDFRDRLYRPPLTSLPNQYPGQDVISDYLARYREDGMILDQGQEGACTGFGLAAVINYLFWERVQRQRVPTSVKVSPRMLYQTAKLYDEWQGEDYQGSSCRGAVKGWHRHGVCDENLWPYWVDGKAKHVEPREGWEHDAASRPLGAYYRIEKNSIVDLQAAIREVHAIYVSAMVHKGWFLGATKRLPVIRLKTPATGGHAFAIVGYDERGFIVQNSWGPDWGYHGFAVLPYSDWVENGMDAWAAVLGAPMATDMLASTFVSKSLQAALGGMRASSGSTSRSAISPRAGATQIWSESEAYLHSLVLENDGRPLNRLIVADNADRALEIVSYERPKAWLEANPGNKLAIYAHGGLNDEQASIQRIRVMAPYFRVNGIYPLFITWRTGVQDSLLNIIEDAVRSGNIDAEALRAEGLISDIRDAFLEAKDRTIEVVARNVLARAIWTQMKQNAAAGATREGGLNKLAAQLSRLLKDREQQGTSLEIHLIGHSAGAILLGHLLTRFITRKLQAASMALYAPACTVAFATDFYGKAIAKGSLSTQATHIDLLSNELELDDSVGPYGKSLLYLVSRALEDVHKMPLLGMAAAWDSNGSDLWANNRLQDIDAWLALWGNGGKLKVHLKSDPPASDGRETIDRTHGHFDNEIAVVGATLQRILGADPQHPVTDLQGF